MIQFAKLDRLALPPPSLQGLVQGDAGEPGREQCLAPETCQASKGLQVSLLHHILGLARITDHRTGDPEEPPVVASHDLAKGGLVARLRESHDVRVIEALQVLSRNRVYQGHGSDLLEAQASTWTKFDSLGCSRPMKCSGLPLTDSAHADGTSVRLQFGLKLELRASCKSLPRVDVSAGRPRVKL